MSADRIGLLNLEDGKTREICSTGVTQYQSMCFESGHVDFNGSRVANKDESESLQGGILVGTSSGVFRY